MEGVHRASNASDKKYVSLSELIEQFQVMQSGFAAERKEVKQRFQISFRIIARQGQGDERIEHSGNAANSDCYALCA